LYSYLLRQHFDAFLQSAAIDAISHSGAIDDRKMLVGSKLIESTELLNNCLVSQAGTLVVVYVQSSFREGFGFSPAFRYQES
jgi:hypothetical protein